MKTRHVICSGIFAVILALALTACDEELDLSGGESLLSGNITYTATQIGGINSTTDSTGIAFVFSASVDGLTADAITVNGTASKVGALTGSGTSWTLPITVGAAGTATVRINKDGIETASKSVAVYKAGQTNPGVGQEPVLGSSWSGYFDYDYTASTIIITGYTGNGGAVNIPSAINGKPVVSIGHDAFWPGKQMEFDEWGGYYGPPPVHLTSVTIPNSVTRIESGAFHQNKLTSITIPNSVTYIGAWAFEDNLLTSVVIPDSVTLIGSGAFNHNRLTSVVTSNKIGAIGFGNLMIDVFSQNQLASITIPNSVRNISGSLEGNRLTSVTIGANVSLMGSEVSVDGGPWQYVPTLPGNFESVYNNGGKLAGTYIFNGTITGSDIDRDQYGSYVYRNYTYTGSWSRQ